WLYRGCTFLVISCPCALVISIPLGLFAGIGAASKKGVLIKGGNYLELLSEIDTIVFDKTGTITKGSFRVVKVEGTQDVLKLAAYGESYSNHPIAMSIVNAYANEIIQDKLSAYQEIAGQGIKAMFEGKTLLVGNAKLLQEQGITFKESVDLGSIIYVAYDGIYQGYIVISDEIKETSLSAIQALKQLGVQKTVMLSGDKKQIAQSVADKIGIDEVHAQLLPQDKVAVLESYLTQEKHKVAFVGDGINDAPVLMRSDIGIAMGAIGSDAAIEASDIVLMNDDLSSISSAIRIARKTKSILYQNIVFSLLVKFVVLLLTSFGLANMWMGVFADVGVTLIAIINAMRALKVK
ncbi:MAG: cadmium-translocating P-type ATPase, partial [Synergistales bacterium]|nr:cadmium-translocating P-type ATPase [Synergistales bacterium]